MIFGAMGVKQSLELRHAIYYAIDMLTGTVNKAYIYTVLYKNMSLLALVAKNYSRKVNIKRQAHYKHILRVQCKGLKLVGHYVNIDFIF